MVGYTYDSLDRMIGASLNGKPVATLGYDVLSRRTLLTYGDTSGVSYGYDAADRNFGDSALYLTPSHVFSTTSPPHFT